MFFRKPAVSLWLALAVLAMPVMAQTQSAPKPAAKPAATPAPAASGEKAADQTPHYLHPETPEQRQARLGTSEDPGPDPDPDKHFWRFGKSYHIEKYEMKHATFTDAEEGYIRPFVLVNIQKEVYQLNDKWVWVWQNDPDPNEQTAQQTAEKEGGHRYTDRDIDFFQKIRPEYAELNVPSGNKVIRFEESSQGLPTSGSWRNSMAVADMNGDGFVDLIVPPERAGGTLPVIFLGDGQGHWKVWSDVKWPHRLDYGNVVAADFNRDGKMDLAFGVHLNGVQVFLGDGKGNFTDASEGLPHNFPTRRVAAVDVDGDGYPDVVAISEGPTAVRQNDDPGYGRIRAYLNRKKGTSWEGINVSDPERPFGGDWLAVGNFNGDGRPDFFGASIYYNSPYIGYMSSGPRQWKPLSEKDGMLIPYVSYYFANTVGKFSSKKLDDAIISYVRFWPSDLNPRTVPQPPAMIVGGIDRISFAGKEPKRTPIVRWTGDRGVWGVASADFDGDGNTDLIYTRFDPREAVILLGDGKGGFTRAKVEGLTLSPNTNYDVKVADVNGDGRPDVILMYESGATTSLSVRDGSIHVFLNRGSADATATTTSTK